ncbi:MAG: hypothetical protein ACRD2J_13490 [Thermoanaerobaculia bacterium]
MRQPKPTQRFLLLSLLVLALAPLSSFAEERPEGMSVTSDLRTDDDRGRGGERDLVGTVLAVAPDGDSFVIRTGRDQVRVEASGGVRVWFRGRHYRVRDLERGDRVAVDLTGSWWRARARSVEVLESVSHRGRYGQDDGRYDRYDDRYDRDDRYGRTLSGRVISYDARRDRMVVRTSSGRDWVVDARRLRASHGPAWERGVRAGEWIELEGRFVGRVFVAEWIGRDARSDYGRYGRR